MDAMSLKKVAYAKELFHRAWSLAAPDGLIQGLADCIAARELIKIKVLENSEYSAREAADALLRLMQPGDALLVKASRGMALEKALALFYPVCGK